MTPTSSKQTRLIIIMIIFVGAVAGYIYYTRFTSPVDQNIALSTDDSRDTLIQFKGIEFDFKIFNSAGIKLLRTFGEAPVRPDLTGKINPFNGF